MRPLVSKFCAFVTVSTAMSYGFSGCENIAGIRKMSDDPITNPMVEIVVDTPPVETNPPSPEDVFEPASSSDSDDDDSSASPGGGSSSSGNNGNSGGSSGSNSDSDGSDSDDPLIGECADRFPGKTIVRITGSQNLIDIDLNSVIYLKVSGNLNQVVLTLSESSQIAGVCIFGTGNQSSVSINVHGTCGELYFKGRGNQSRADVNVSLSGALDRIRYDLSGNQSSLAAIGAGASTCASATGDQSGHNSTFSCQ